MKLLSRFILIASLCTMQTACSNMQSSRSGLVEQAFNTYGTVPVKPYKRTIFSSMDF